MKGSRKLKGESISSAEASTGFKVLFEKLEIIFKDFRFFYFSNPVLTLTFISNGFLSRF